MLLKNKKLNKCGCCFLIKELFFVKAHIGLELRKLIILEKKKDCLKFLFFLEKNLIINKSSRNRTHVCDFEDHRSTIELYS